MFSGRRSPFTPFDPSRLSDTCVAYPGRIGDISDAYIALGSSGKIVEPRRQSHRVARRKLHTARWHLPVSQCFTLVSTSEPAERVSAFRRRCLRPRRTDGQVVAIFHIRTRILSGQAMVVCQASRLSRRRVGTIKLAGLDSRTLGAPRCKLNMRLPVSKPLAGA